MATAEKYSCCTMLGVSVPGFLLAPRGGQISGRFAALSRSVISADSGMPLPLPVASSTMMVASPVRAV